MDTPIAAPLAEAKAHAGETVGRARKRLAKDARKATKKATKGVRKNAKRARKTVVGTASDVLTTALPGKPKRRRWPWLVGAGMLAAGAGTAAYVLKTRQPSATDEVPEQHGDSSSSNGTAPQPRQEQPADSPARHN
ncbi:MAG TPA: hypothetical protein VHV49_03000 [Pseudonocardiaceae bacterium]|jgi:hypothetical protein|nr:hypothetical protein [Pseudonocardiaceae bacterium]